MVIVHGNQDNNAKATILWDNAFSEMVRKDLEWPWREGGEEQGQATWAVMWGEAGSRHVQMGVAITPFIKLSNFTLLYF